MFRILFFLTVSASAVPAAAADLLVVGIDRKIAFTENGLEKVAPTKDELLVYDIETDPAKPRLLERWEASNSVIGPPTNIAVGPDGNRIVLADSLRWVETSDGWNGVPTERMEVHARVPTDDPPTWFVASSVGRTFIKNGVTTDGNMRTQPSGLAFGHGGEVAIALRAVGAVTTIEVAEPVRDTDGGYGIPAGHGLPDTWISVGKGSQPAAVAFTPDGDRILVAKFAAHAVGVLERDGDGWSYNEADDLTVGRWPYNVQVSPLGTVAIVANNGNAGMPDGHVDTVSVIDLTAEPPRVVEHVVVGDGPEGLAISPDGRWALVTILNGSAPHMRDAWYGNPTGLVAVLAIDGTEVTLADTIEVGRFPEGVGFNKAGTHAYVGDLLDDRVTILAVGTEGVTHTGTYVELPGPPASLRTCLP